MSNSLKASTVRVSGACLHSDTEEAEVGRSPQLRDQPGLHSNFLASQDHVLSDFIFKKFQMEENVIL